MPFVTNAVFNSDYCFLFPYGPDNLFQEMCMHRVSQNCTVKLVITQSNFNRYVQVFAIMNDEIYTEINYVPIFATHKIRI